MQESAKNLAPISTCKDAPTILCVWEMGGDLGHISRHAKLTKVLTQHQFKVGVVLRDLSRASPYFAKDVQLMQAPVWLPQIKMQRPIACLADTLLVSGYLEKESLLGLVRGWQSLYELVQPDLIVFDYAPTAMLAARHLATPKISISNGFAEPEPGSAIADWRPYLSEDKLVEFQEQKVVATINEVFAEYSQPPIHFLSDLFSSDCKFINTFPELDLYQSRENTWYCPHTSSPNTFPKVDFKSTKDKKIIAYLKPWHTHIKVLIEGLALCDAEIIVVCPKVNTSDYASFMSDRFRLFSDPIDLPHSLAQADLFVGHGNTGSLTESIVRGTPVASLPEHLEQYLFAKNTQALDLGILIDKVGSAQAIKIQIEEALHRTDRKEIIQQFLGHTAIEKRSIENIFLEEVIKLIPQK